jgi:hypothetical protein
MRLLLEPLMPGILADIAPDEILKVQYGFDAAKRHIEGLDDLATFEEDIARKERRRESLPRKELRWYKVKVRDLSRQKTRRAYDDKHRYRLCASPKRQSSTLWADTVKPLSFIKSAYILRPGNCNGILFIIRIERMCSAGFRMTIRSLCNAQTIAFEASISGRASWNLLSVFSFCCSSELGLSIFFGCCSY